MTTLILTKGYSPYPNETQNVGFVQANHLGSFPSLLDQCQFNRRSRALCFLVELLLWYWIQQRGWLLQAQYLLDTKPVLAIGYNHSKRNSDFARTANFGKSTNCSCLYFGFKLISIPMFSDFPAVNDLISANLDECQTIEAVIDYQVYGDIFVDSGFVGLELQTQIFEQTNNLIWTLQSSIQYLLNTLGLDRWLSSIRECIEGTFHEIQNTGRYIKRLLTKTVEGLCTRVIPKMTSHLLRFLLCVDFGVNVQTFEMVALTDTNYIRCNNKFK